MRLVIDTNRIMAALIKDSYSRRLLVSEKFEFVSLDFGLAEVKKHSNYIMQKAKLRKKDFNELLNRIVAHISIFEAKAVSKKSYTKARHALETVDKADIPFLALALELECDGIWSDDKHFSQQRLVKVWTTKALQRRL